VVVVTSPVVEVDTTSVVDVTPSASVVVVDVVVEPSAALVVVVDVVTPASDVVVVVVVDVVVDVVVVVGHCGSPPHGTLRTSP